MIIRSLKAQTNIHLISSKKILYIEDSKGVGNYSSLLKNILKEKSSMIKVISLDSKSNVINHFIKLKNTSKIDNQAFLVDLDFDCFLKKNIISHNSFFYLDKYTFENYLIDENLAINILSIFANLNTDDAAKKLEYNEWANKIAKAYTMILPLFLAIRTLDSHPVETSKCDCNELFDMNNFELDNNKIKNYLKKIPKDLKCGQHICQQIKNFSLSINEEFIFDNIPGKQLLKLLITKINKNLKKHINEQSYRAIALAQPKNNLNMKMKKISTFLLS